MACANIISRLSTEKTVPIYKFPDFVSNFSLFFVDSFVFFFKTLEWRHDRSSIPLLSLNFSNNPLTTNPWRFLIFFHLYQKDQIFPFILYLFFYPSFFFPIILGVLARREDDGSSIHPTAVVHPDAVIGKVSVANFPSFLFCKQNVPSPLSLGFWD